MTTCVAALCGNGTAIVLAADKMVGHGFIESETGSKIVRLHRDWWVMLSGNGVEPAYPIIDKAARRLARNRALDVSVVMETLVTSYQEERLEEAEHLHLKPRGLNLKQFIREGKNILVQTDFIRLGDNVERTEFEIWLLVAGFDDKRRGHIFSIDGGPYDRGIARRHAGFHAIGSGQTNALFFLNYRELSPKMPVREALYYVLEAKYYGELAPGVGPQTDLYVRHPGKREIKIDDEGTIEKRLIKQICQRIEPQELKPQHMQILNQLEELRRTGFPRLTKPTPRKAKAVPVKVQPTSRKKSGE